MNILEVCVVPDLGGLELYFHRCCVALLARGHDIMSVRLEGSRLAQLGSKDGVPTLQLKRGNKFFPLQNARTLAQLIRNRKIEVIHCHHRKDLALVAMAKQLSKTSVRLVFTRQMPMNQSKKDPYHTWIYRRIDLFLTITELLKREAIEKLPVPASRIHRLYYGVPSPPPKDNDYCKQFLTISTEGDFNIGVFSRLENQKGQHLVIAALKKIREAGVPCKLYIVGHVMYEDYKETLVATIHDSKLDSHVAFKGFIDQPVKAMQGMDVLVLPSRNEAFGLVLAEAMRCGIVVMGVNAGGVPEIIDHLQTGMLFEWDNIDQLSEQIITLYKNPALRNELARRGKEKADREFDNDLHFERLENWFKSVVG